MSEISPITFRRKRQWQTTRPTEGQARWRCRTRSRPPSTRLKKKRKRGRSSRSLVWTKFGARCCCDKKKRDDRWWESTGLVTVASYRRRHHLVEEVPGLYIRRLTLEDPRRREPSSSRSPSPARHICHPRSDCARLARGSSRYRSGSEI